MSIARVQQPETEADVASVTAAARSAIAAVLDDPQLSRVVVTGRGDRCADLFLAAVVARLMISERLDVEVAYCSPSATTATRRWRLPIGPAADELARAGTARELPLIRDDAATVMVGRARQLGVGDRLYGEAYVDSVRLFDGTVTAVEIEPLAHEPGVRGRVARRLPGGWKIGRAVQTGGPEVIVEREGIAGDRPVKRSTFYLHHQPWHLVCR